MGSRLTTKLGAILLTTALTAGVSVAAPRIAAAQFPSLPEVPGVPGLPPLPAPPQLPPPEIPGVPGLPPPPVENGPGHAGGDKPPELPGGLELPPQLQGKDVVPRKIGGFDFEPPAPIQGMRTPTGETFTVQSDSTRLLGNVKMSYVQIDTAQGIKPAIRIDADRVELDNLRVRFPGSAAGVEDIWQRTGPGKITTLNGDFHIIVAKMTITSEIAGVRLPIPITIDASWAPEDVRVQLASAGAGLPDELSDKMAVVDGTMETYFISANDLVAQDGMSIKP